MILALASAALFNACASTSTPPDLSGKTTYLKSPPPPPEIQKPPADNFLIAQEITELEKQLAVVDQKRDKITERKELIQGLLWEPPLDSDEVLNRLRREESELRTVAPNSDEWRQTRQELDHVIEALEFGKELQRLQSSTATEDSELATQAANLEREITKQKAKLTAVRSDPS